MTIHHIVHVEGLNALTDLVQMIYEKLNDINARDIRSVEVIDGSDPAVQNALGIKPEITFRGTDGRFTHRGQAGVDIDVEKVDIDVEKVNPTEEKRRWTDKEIRIVVEGLNMGKTHEDIQRSLMKAGFERTFKAVKHRVNEIKRNARRR